MPELGQGQKPMSEKIYDVERIEKLNDALISSAHTLLLFTQYISKVKFFHIPETASDPSVMKELLCIEKDKVKLQYLYLFFLFH